MKRKYEACEVLVCQFASEDVIRTSQNGTVSKDHFGDGNWWEKILGGEEA